VQLDVPDEGEQAVLGHPPLLGWIGAEPHAQRVVGEAVASADRAIHPDPRVRMGRVEGGGDEPLIVVDRHVDRETVGQAEEIRVLLALEGHALAAGLTLEDELLGDLFEPHVLACGYAP
jgi:hypothetical protein